MTRRRGPAGAAAAATIAGALVATALGTVLGPAAERAAAAEPVAAGAPAPVGGSLLGFSGTVAGTAGGVPDPPQVVAGGWLVADLGTGDVLAAHDPHGRYAPASCLKLLTALTVVPHLEPAEQVRATSADVAVGGTLVGMVPGHAYPVSELLQGMLMVSGNDAATALANAAGGVGATTTAMNAEARTLHADDTDARGVDGLDVPGQVSSAYDLALIARAALALPSVRADVATTRATFASTGVPAFQIQNHNPLLGVVPGVYGAKNGYTVAAQASYVGVARRGDRTVIVVLLRTRPDFAAEATALLDWGFTADGHVSPVGLLVPPGGTAVAAAPSVAPSGATSGRGGPAVAAPARDPQRSRGSLSDPQYLGVGAAAALAVVVWHRERSRRRRRRAPRFRRRTWR